MSVVVVVGGGMAGLTAVLRLSQRVLNAVRPLGLRDLARPYPEYFSQTGRQRADER